MIRLLVDQNFNGHILDGLTRRDPGLEMLHVREVGLAAAQDPSLLEWAATQGRVLLTHDRRTIPAFAYSRVAAGQPRPGVFLISDEMPVAQAIDEILLAVHCLSPDECKDIVKYFPLQVLRGEIRNTYLKSVQAPIGVKPALKAWMELS